MHERLLAENRVAAMKKVFAKFGGASVPASRQPEIIFRAAATSAAASAGVPTVMRR
jgi:hypothetical protein